MAGTDLTDTTSQPLVAVIGASARYACLSLRQAGFQSHGIDLFADLETRLAGSAVRVAHYPAELFPRLRDSQANTWMYTGGVENCSKHVAEAAVHIPLLGASTAALRSLRSPHEWNRLFGDCGIQTPAIVFAHHNSRAGWLAKSSHSCGGLGVVEADAADPNTKGLYFQRRTEGDVLGVTFVAQDGISLRLGATIALDTARHPWIGATSFVYGGSIGPVDLNSDQEAMIEQLGQRIAEVEGMRGVFGVDLIRDQQGTLHLIDINPRLPASAELLERATNVPIAGLHVQACLGNDIRPAANRLRTAVQGNRAKVHGKAIVYAKSSARTNELRQHAARSWQDARCHWLADTPAEDQRIKAGSPIASVFAMGADASDVMAQLRERATQVRELTLED